MHKADGPSIVVNLLQIAEKGAFCISSPLEPAAQRRECYLVSTLVAAIQVCGQAVQEAVQDALQQALDENVRFDVRANFFTLIAITGVILFWRGIWSLW